MSCPTPRPEDQPVPPTGDDIRDLLLRLLPVQRRIVHAGEPVYRAGDPFRLLYFVHSGFFKIVSLARDGREQLVGLNLRQDWLGLDGIATGRYGCDAIAMDTGEVWAVPYEALLRVCGQAPSLLTGLHAAMSREIGRERDAMMSLCTLPADARVADFLRNWADTLARHGLRSDQISLRMTRAEIGNFLGMTLETVSRALSRLARLQLIRFDERRRREIRIPDAGALTLFVENIGVADGQPLRP
ncbi:MAG: Crp/Fnr family transcriptional regulator [Burkholderiaceae bacterium]